MEKIIVIGNGMTGYKFCEKMAERGLSQKFDMTVFGEENVPAYDRVHLTDYYTGSSVEELLMNTRDWYKDNKIDLHTNELVVKVDVGLKNVETHTGAKYPYDKLVFATGSRAFVPPIPGREKEGVFVYRTFEDLDAIKAYIPRAKKAHVIGGGLLGLEAAKALLDDGLKTSVVEIAPRLMPRQLDTMAGEYLKNKLESLGVNIVLGKMINNFTGNGSVTGIDFKDEDVQDTDMVVISAGIAPRDELARAIGLDVGPRGGIVVNEFMQTSEKDIYAIGECALALNMVWGLVAPCYEMAEILVEQLQGKLKSFEGFDMSTKLKLIGIDVASFGDALGNGQQSDAVVLTNPKTGNYKRLNISTDGKYILGGILVGDAEDYTMLHQMMANKMPLPEDPSTLLVKGGGDVAFSITDLPDTATICSCENVSKGTLLEAMETHDITQLGPLKLATKAGTGCGGCVPTMDELITETLKQQGKVVKKVICEHFDFTRQELYDLVKINGLKDFKSVISKHGSGRGCEICKPLVASLLASIWNETIATHSPIQDTNDRFLANIQRGGTYSVVPRIPGGEITPDKLVVIGEVAKEFNLYTKITGGQRIDLFGAHVNDLPKIWGKLIAAGFESGHAYGKALRTVKSCVGSTWCRFGQQDAVSFAIEIEERYKGIRAPHKLKGGVSGCIRECAEARGKDFGIIATEKGWNLYVCGNGGANPKHAELLAADIDKETVIKYLDRFLIYYIRTAGPLIRTAKWLNQLEGGLRHLKEVVINDSLGKAAEFEEDMRNLISTYQCEWKVAIETPELRKNFSHFINTDEKDSTVEFVALRGQKKPVDWK